MFDIIIIGGGPGGYHLAAEAGKVGMEVALIEKERLGGTCLNTGCIPSKAFLHIEKIVNEANHSHDNGVVGSPLSIDQNKVVAYKNKKVDFLVSGVEAKVKAAGVKVFNSHGEIQKSQNPGEFSVKTDKETIVGKNLVIATGSTPFIPEFIKGTIEGHKDGYVITSTEALDLKEIPKEMVVIGGGVIGLELGSYFASAGSKVTIIEAGPKIAGVTDLEITAQFQEVLEKDKKMTFLLNCKAKEISKSHVIYEDELGKEVKLSHSKVLVAIGRKANTDCGLDNIGVNVEKGIIPIDDKCKTNVPGVWAIGDVTGKLMLAQTASKHAEIVIDNILGENVSIDYDKIPIVIYGAPEIAEIGVSELKAKQRGIKVEIKKLAMLYSGKFVIDDLSYPGLFKVILKKDTQEIIGMSVFGNSASELIHMGSIIIGKKI